MEKCKRCNDEVEDDEIVRYDDELMCIYCHERILEHIKEDREDLYPEEKDNDEKDGFNS